VSRGGDSPDGGLSPLAGPMDAATWHLQRSDLIFNESKGDYCLTQQLCQSICAMGAIIETQASKRTLSYSLADLRKRVVDKLRAAYYPAITLLIANQRAQGGHSCFSTSYLPSEGLCGSDLGRRQARFIVDYPSTPPKGVPTGFTASDGTRNGKLPYLEGRSLRFF
jgi:hypothetical protein